jgi:serine/threonine protein kinase/Tfp pilus assembly protein PilF
MKCPKCSLENADTQRFCGDCGTRLFLEKGEEASRTETIKLPSIDLNSGSTFAERYQIIEELGKGGMGRVYRALDKKLNEEIAIKLIRPEIAWDAETVKRFRTELKTARQVVHKNVARMFDLNEEQGVPYITMEYVRGENLKNLIRKVGRLSAQQAVPIAKQVAEGLAEAHRREVVHRDLKPQNIMIDEQGKARITDFGLARLKKTDDATATAPVMGTPAYVSPEQVEGLPVDGRSDLYSLGIVMYEMVTGKPPFQGDSPYSIALQHIVAALPDPRGVNPEIPESLSRVIMKCLEKDRKRRYQNAEELISDLDALEKDFSTGVISGPKPALRRGLAWKWILSGRIPLIFFLIVALGVGGYFVYKKLMKPPERPSKISIAVLPVEDQSLQKDRERLCSGLQEDIILKLSSIPELRVIPRLSVSNYDGSGKDSRQIGKEIGADYLLKATLQTEGKRLRVRVEMSAAKSNSVVQQYTYERDLEDFFTVQDEISRYIARALKVNVVEERLRTIKRREPKDLEAYYHYLEGMRLIEEVYHNTAQPEDFAQAVEMYQKAIDIDPNYALAYWGLGNAYEARYNSSSQAGDPKDLEMMKNYYLEAHKIEPNFAETNLGLGWMYFNLENNVSASQHFKRAVELDPNNFIVNLDVGAFLRSVGLYDKAVKYFSRALEIDPYSVPTRILKSTCLMFLGEFDKAVLEIGKAIEQDPDNVEARFHYASDLILMNRLNEAEQEIEIARKIDPSGQTMTLPQALLCAARGEKDKALELISGKEAMNVVTTGTYIFLGMKDEAIRTIEEGIERGFEVQRQYLFAYPLLNKNPIFKTLKSEPRFQEILHREKAKYKEKLKKFAPL